MKLLPLAAALVLAGCTSAQQLSAITIAAEAMPCYAAVLAATQSGNDTIKALTAAQVAATDSACAKIGANAATLIASAINAGAPVVKGAVSMPVARRMPG